MSESPDTVWKTEVEAIEFINASLGNDEVKRDFSLWFIDQYERFKNSAFPLSITLEKPRVTFRVGDPLYTPITVCNVGIYLHDNMEDRELGRRVAQCGLEYDEEKNVFIEHDELQDLNVQ